jgi:diguanylate cyclase (GGDEF)-like protein
LKRKPPHKRPGSSQAWKRLSFSRPKAFFWTFAAGTFALAAILGLVFNFLALGSEHQTLLLGWLLVAALTSVSASFVASRILALAWDREISLEHLATIDELTGAPNRRIFASRLESEVDRCSRLASALCVVFIDIDFFKRINDDYGHQIGDRVLKEIYSRLEENLRPYDFIGRMGGDEFVMALPGTETQTAFGVAERLRESVQRIAIADLPPVTVSLGVAELEHNMDADQLLRNADIALYAAKNKGRNRTQVYRPHVVPSR